jgi:hypothetical protein
MEWELVGRLQFVASVVGVYFWRLLSMLVYDLISFGGGVAVSVLLLQGPLPFLLLLFGHYIQELSLASFLSVLSLFRDLPVTKCRGSQWLSFRICLWMILGLFPSCTSLFLSLLAVVAGLAEYVYLYVVHVHIDWRILGL